MRVATHFIKSVEARDELLITLYLQSENILFCQDACQCLMLLPYITASRTIVNVVLN